MIVTLIALVTGGVLGMRAYTGSGTRSLYLAAMLFALACSGLCQMLLLPSQRDVWLAVAFGCLLAVILYRRPAPSAP